MFKKFIILGGVTLALLAFAIPSLAYDYRRGSEGTEIEIETVATANTGGNSQSNITSVLKAHEVIALTGSLGGNRTIVTGDAYANAQSLAIVNTNEQHSRRGPSQSEGGLELSSRTAAVADSGLNYQDNMTSIEKASEVAAGSISLGGSSTIRTGAASSVVSNRTLVNVQPIRWGR